MKKTKLFITTLALVFVLIFNVVGCSLVEYENATDVDLENTVEAKNEYTEHRISLNSAGNVVYGENYVGQTLTATITPVSAFNPLVNWTVTWADSSVTEDISTYIQVIPQYDGALVAEVRCFKALPCNATVTVTTDDGGYTASCTVVFLGIPTSLSITSGTSKDESGKSTALTTDTSGNYLAYTDGWHSLRFNISLSNIFNSVGTEFESFTYEVLSITGNIRVANAVDDSAGDRTYYTSTLTTKPLNNYADEFDVLFEDNILRIDYDFENRIFESTEYGSSDETYYTNLFYSFIDTETYIMSVKVTNISGLSQTINIKFSLGAVTDVNLSDSTLEF